MNKPIESNAGWVTMADGTRREAYRNVYKVMTFEPGAASPTVTHEVRIEFQLFTNAARGGGRRYRATTIKQSATFALAANLIG